MFIPQKLGETPPDYKCHKNWDGPSKAMESNVAVQLVKEIETKNAEVSALVMMMTAQQWLKSMKILSQSY